MSACPTCGHGLPALRVDLSINALFHGKLTLALTPSEAELLFILVTRAPNVVSTDNCMAALYGNEGRWRASGHPCLRVFIHNVRAKLQGTGLSIKTHTGRGFSFHVDEGGEE